MAKIMIVDDSKIVTSIISKHFSSRGHEVQVANSPFGVTNMVRECQPDIVLMDLGLPGLSGNKLLEMIHGLQNISRARVIIISSAEEQAMRELVRSGEADDYFVKGTDMDILDIKIMTQLGKTAGKGYPVATGSKI